MRKHKLILGGAIVLLIAVGVSVFFVIRARESRLKTGKSVTSKDQAVLDAAAKDYTNKETNRVTTLASKVKSLDDLKKLPVADQGVVGLWLINTLQSTDKGKARQYAMHVMLLNDAAAIEAATLCYRLSGTDADKLPCKMRANDLARQRKQIGPNEELPDSYYKDTPATEQQG